MMILGKFNYPAQFFVEKDGVSVSFPDFPGCLPCGENLEEAIYNAKEALTVHLQGMIQDEENIPFPAHGYQFAQDPKVINLLVEVIFP